MLLAVLTAVPINAAGPVLVQASVSDMMCRSWSTLMAMCRPASTSPCRSCIWQRPLRLIKHLLLKVTSLSSQWSGL